MTIVRSTERPPGRMTRPTTPRRTTFGWAPVLLLVTLALGLTSCSTTASATVTLRPARPGEVSALVGHRFASSAASQEIRFTSGTGKAIQVISYQLQDGNLLPPGMPTTTVVDAGPSGPWTTVAPGYTFGTTPQDLALRLITTGTADLTLSYEIRGVDRNGQATSGASTISPTGPDCAKAPPRADLRAIDLSGLDLQGCFMAGVTLDPAKLSNTELTAADLSGATILPGALANTNLIAARLGDSILARVDVSHSSISDASFVDADLDHAVLRHVDLADTDLTGVDLSTATLEGVRSGGIIGSPTLPPGWTLRGGYLFAPGVDLADAFLQDLDLAGLNLTGADLRSAFLRGAKLQGTVLAGTDLTGAFLQGSTGTPIYTGAHFQATECPDGTSSDAHGATCQGHPWP